MGTKRQQRFAITSVLVSCQSTSRGRIVAPATAPVDSSRDALAAAYLISTLLVQWGRARRQRIYFCIMNDDDVIMLQPQNGTEDAAAAAAAVDKEGKKDEPAEHPRVPVVLDD